MFQKVLDQLIERVPEALAATFNDRDGEPLCCRAAQVPEEALQLLAAYDKAIRRQLQQALEELDQGEVRQVAFATDRHWILMLGAQEQCTLVLVMAREGLLGRARYHMEQAIQALNQEL
ncbi:MAG: roadblock/LC7 domain-containing protein [Holophagaceae bacterium]